MGFSRQEDWSGVPLPSPQHTLDHRKNKRILKKNICSIDCAKAFDCMDYNKLWNILKEMGILDHITCLLRNLYSTGIPEKAMALHSSTLAWEIPWTEEPGRLQSMGSRRVGQD